MEVLLMTSFLLGLWMNWSFAIRSKPNWTNLHALRKLVGFQLTVNFLNIAVHLLLLIPWPFWGYAINPRDFLWTVDPLTCRLVTVAEEVISISCAASATAIFVTNLEKQELRQERKRKIAFCLVLVTFCIGGVCAVVYTELVPLLKLGTLSILNCPSHSFSLLCGQKELKYAFITFVLCSVLLFWNLDHRSSCQFSESRLRNILNYFFRCLSIACQCTTICALVFAVACIPIYFSGGSLYSVTFNTAKLYFDITTLAVSVCLPPLLVQVHADINGGTAHSVESSLMERSPDTGQRLIKIRINENALKT